MASWINGFEPFFYVHDGKQYKYTSFFEDSATLEMDYLDPFTIDSRDIKSVIVYDHPVYVTDFQQLCPLFLESSYYQIFTDSLIRRGYEKAIFKRRVLVDILLKDGRDLSTRSELFNLNKRVTTVDGYSRPYQFYAPEYPDGPVFGDVDYRRTLYWNPNVITDTDGQATVEFYNNSITRHFNISAAGMTSSGIPYILDKDW